MKKSTLDKKVAQITAAGEKFALQYRSRSGMFSNHNYSCTLDLVAEIGHSYRWWEMFKRINGVLVRNTYNYSPTTCKHINKVWSVCNKLGIKTLALEAPKGLQDLESAKKHVLRLYGDAVVKFQHARKPSKYETKYALSQIKTLQKIGVKVTEREKLLAVVDAEERRDVRLEDAKAKREREKLAVVPAPLTTSLTLVVNNSEVESA